MFGSRKKVVPVQTYGSPVLKTLAAPVNGITPEIMTLADEMIESMFAFDGIGLAAPQIGISLRLVTLAIPNQLPDDYEPSPGELRLLPLMPLALVNPVILSFGKDKSLYEEGCLSVPEIYAEVERPTKVMLQAEIIGHGPVMVECGGLLSRCIQHEIDHLDGKLFVERLTPDNLNKVKRQLDRLYELGQKNKFQRTKK